MKTLIFLPIEVKNREFYSKLFFANRAIEKNFVCFIGDKIAINRAIRYFGNGVYYYKSMNFYDTNHIDEVKKKGNIYVVQDEEGAVLNEKEFTNFTKIRGSEKNLQKIDRFYTWGSFDHDIWKKSYFKLKKKFLLVGSPRIDIWKKKNSQKIYSKEIDQIKKKYGKFSLILSSGISSKNELKKKLKIDKITRAPLNETQQEIYRRNIWQLKINKELFQIAKNLSKKNPNKKFIFRPHPDENLEDYVFNNQNFSKNLIINSSFDVMPWLISADQIIQSCSTSAIQAKFVQKKIISYVPNYLKNIHRSFPNKIGKSFKSKQELYKSFLSSNKNKFDNKLISQRFYKFDKNVLSSDLIVKDLLKLVKNKKFSINYVFFFILGFLYDLKDYFILRGKSKTNSYYKARRTLRQKNPGISKDEILTFFKKIMSKNKKIKVFKFLKNGYLIYK